MRLPRVRIRVRWPRRRALSVRGLMILILMIGCGLGWVMHRARVQREAVEAIIRAGGEIIYDWEFADGKFLGV